MENRTIRLVLFGALGAVLALWVRGLVVDGFDAWMTLGAVVMTILIGAGILAIHESERRDREESDRNGSTDGR